MQIFYKTKSEKTFSLEINQEDTMQKLSGKIQDKGRIKPSNVCLQWFRLKRYFISIQLKKM